MKSYKRDRTCNKNVIIVNLQSYNRCDIHYVQSYVISITGNPRENLPDVILSAFLLRDDFQNKPPTVFQHRQLSVGKSLISTLSLHRI